MADGTRTVFVQPSTGGRFEVRLGPQSSVRSLKTAIARRLKMPEEKFVLLYRNKQLNRGSLLDNNVPDGSRLTLLPSVETGTAAPNAERCVLQALETLDETQVDGFLEGRTPLNLSMRVGDHVMFVQLQLSALPPTPPTTPTSAAPEDFPPTPPPSPTADPVLCAASRHLTQTLRGLSCAALEQKMRETCDGRCGAARKRGGAVIDSMFHHGHGVFSGTFSGTLNPLLQDDGGRPRKNVCTVVHILNDLLGAPSHCNPCQGTPSSRGDGPGRAEGVDTPPTGAPENDCTRAKMRHIRDCLRARRRSRPYPRGEDSSETAVA